MGGERTLRVLLWEHLKIFKWKPRRNKKAYPCPDLCPMAHLNLNSQLITPEPLSRLLWACLHALGNFRNADFSMVWGCCCSPLWLFAAFFNWRFLFPDKVPLEQQEPTSESWREASSLPRHSTASPLSLHHPLSQSLCFQGIKTLVTGILKRL